VETGSRQKAFDCVEMKNCVQAEWLMEKERFGEQDCEGGAS